MEFSEALPLLQENHTAVVSTVGPSGKVQATIVSSSVLDGKVAFASRGQTIKLKNIRRNGRAAITVIKLDTRRYATVEGPVTVHEWEDAEKHLALLRDVYTAMGRAPENPDDFESAMRKDQRAVVLISPERVYGSLGR